MKCCFVFYLFFVSSFVFVFVSSLFLFCSVDDVNAQILPQNVLGQAWFTTSYVGYRLNQFFNPTDVYSDVNSKKVFISDCVNNRIMRFNTTEAMMSDGSAELIIFGDLYQGGCSSSQLNYPQQITTFENSMFIADTANMRVLRIENFTGNSTVAYASSVFGQSSFSSCQHSKKGSDDLRTLWQPVGVAVDTNATLYVSDMMNNLVKRFDNALNLENFPFPNGYLGVPGKYGASGSMFYHPTYLGMDRFNSHLFVSDQSNNRILLFRNAQTKPNSSSADSVFGQASFETNSADCNQFSLQTPTEPFYFAQEDLLIFSDSWNNRVLVWSNVLEATNGEKALYLVGQSNFSECASPQKPRQNNLWSPEGIDLNPEIGIDLMIVDSGWNRVLRFDTPK